jgi:hypothetical protein
MQKKGIDAYALNDIDRSILGRWLKELKTCTGSISINTAVGQK